MPLIDARMPDYYASIIAHFHDYHISRGVIIAMRLISITNIIDASLMPRLIMIHSDLNIIRCRQLHRHADYHHHHLPSTIDAISMPLID